jgi:uncharacterized protein DUF1840
MLVTFKSGAHSEFTMFAEIAEDLLKMMGHSGTIPSALAAKDVPEALKNLKQALEYEPDALVEETSSDDEHTDVEGRAPKVDALGDNAGAVADEEPDVSLSGRAFPLIEMLTAAIEDESTVMWYKS